MDLGEIWEVGIRQLNVCPGDCQRRAAEDPRDPRALCLGDKEQVTEGRDECSLLE